MRLIRFATYRIDHQPPVRNGIFAGLAASDNVHLNPLDAGQRRSVRRSDATWPVGESPTANLRFLPHRQSSARRSRARDREIDESSDHSSRHDGRVALMMSV
jgi:hypothetical protein